ncbi:uncharacterized protein LOC141926205 [Strix aluco]|uniref:uncharacterized protein LOC141926205 n=1 Tax=Strix aluco TaxID=111821 RepID=UPI003DA3CD69
MQECAYTKHVYGKPVNLKISRWGWQQQRGWRTITRNLPLPSLNHVGKLSAGFPASWAIPAPPLNALSQSCPRARHTVSNQRPQTCSFVPDTSASALRLHKQQVTSPRSPAEKMLFSSCPLWKTLFFTNLAVLLADFTEIGAFASPSECESANIQDVNESLAKYSKCFHEMIAKGEKTSINLLAWTLQETLDLLRPVQEKFCKQLPPCPLPVAPRNGGLVCVTIDNAQYCKPMCNKGYDFPFLRRSRLYEVCGNATGFSWTTQLVGEKTLAVCNPSEMAVSGAKSAYFPTNSTCMRTLAGTETQAEQLNIFLRELHEQGIDSSNHDKEADCIICGY